VINPGLEGRIVVVTGANNPRGIGAAVARAFAAQGAKILLHYLRVDTDARIAKPPDEVLRAIGAVSGRAQAWEADLADPMTIPQLLDEAERAFGPVDILLNNAAHSEVDTFVPTGKDLRKDPVSAASVDRSFAVNTRAVALLMAEFARRHVARGADWGRIINVSTAGAYVFPSEVSYGASKLALEAYTRSAAVELGQFGISVNAVSLGPVQTGWIPPELEKRLVSTIPLGRIGTPEEVADVIVFLASDQARWVRTASATGWRCASSSTTRRWSSSEFGLLLLRMPSLTSSRDRRRGAIGCDPTRFTPTGLSTVIRPIMSPPGPWYALQAVAGLGAPPAEARL
jgi:3-oxoacyl-[acyl-carrier protein] reductase